MLALEDRVSDGDLSCRLAQTEAAPNGTRPHPERTVFSVDAGME